MPGAVLSGEDSAVVPIEFDFMQPLPPLWRLVHQFGELRFDPTWQRRRVGAAVSRERWRRAVITRNRTRPVYGDLLAC
jgi:hypothetical protein